MLASKIGSVKEDVRFREIILESFILGCSTPKEASVNAEINRKVEIWGRDFWAPLVKLVWFVSALKVLKALWSANQLTLFYR